MPSRLRAITTVVTIGLLALAAGRWFRTAQPPESLLDRANRICQACGPCYARDVSEIEVGS